ncbi:MAG: hypothetical protein RR367_04215, partial [Clostridia bacterium]
PLRRALTAYARRVRGVRARARVRGASLKDIMVADGCQLCALPFWGAVKVRVRASVNWKESDHKK